MEKERLPLLPEDRNSDSVDPDVHRRSGCKYVVLCALCFAVFTFVGVYFTVKSSRPNNSDNTQTMYPQSAGTKVSVSVNFDTAVHTIDERYVSVTIGDSLIRDRFEYFNTSSVKLLTLASALSPCYLRLGGTAEDLLIFQNGKTESEGLAMEDRPFSKPMTNFTMTASDWDTIHRFVVAAGWKLVFGLNIFLRDGNQWDPSNARCLLQYSQRKGYRFDLELGNEPNSFQHVFGRFLDPAQAGRDFGILKKLMKSLPAFASSLLIGPDVTSIVKRPKELDVKREAEKLMMPSDEYLKKFLQTGSQNVDVVSFHHYYVREQTTTLADFTNSSVLDRLDAVIQKARSIVNMTAGKAIPIWEGESGSASGGGAVGLSDRYVAGFMWLDRLGLSAVSGIDVVIRHSFCRGNYALIDRKDYTPNPDYWLTLLYKRLVGRRVFSVQLNTTSRDIRLYAHCTRVSDSSPYQAGALTIYVLNLQKRPVQLKFTQFTENVFDLYLLTPGGEGTLTSRTVKLNGKELAMRSESELPLLQPVSQSGDSSVVVNALSFGFVVVPRASIPLCA